MKHKKNRTERQTQTQLLNLPKIPNSHTYVCGIQFPKFKPNLWPTELDLECLPGRRVLAADQHYIARAYEKNPDTLRPSALNDRQIHNVPQKGTYQEAQFKFFCVRRHGSPEKRQHLAACILAGNT